MISTVSLLQVISNTNKLAQGLKHTTLAIVKNQIHANYKMREQIQAKVNQRYMRRIKMRSILAYTLVKKTDKLLVDSINKKNYVLDILKNFAYFYSNDFFYILHYTPKKLTAVLLPVKDYSQLLAKENIALIEKFIVTNKEGYLHYKFRDLKTKQQDEAIVYIKLYSKWNWVIISGFISKQAEHAHHLFTIEKNLESIFGFATPESFIFILDKNNQVIFQPRDLHLKLNISKDLSSALINIADTCQGSCYYTQKTRLLTADKSAKWWKFLVTKYKPLDWVIIYAIRLNKLHAAAYNLAYHLLAFNLLILMVSIAIGLLFGKKITTALQHLISYVRVFQTRNFVLSKPALQEINQLALRKNDIGLLAKTFLELNRSLHKYVRKLKYTTALKERMVTELNIAQQMQQSMLPTNNYLIAKKYHFELHALLKPAYYVAGDFYDFYFIDKKSLFFIVSDVSDKGVAAFLFAAIVKTMIDMNLKRTRDIGKLLQHVNQEIIVKNKLNMFITLFLGILNLKTKELNYVNAGHTIPILVHNGLATFLATEPQPMIGILPNIRYKAQKILLHADDLLFVYTDGVTEAMNKENKLFGEQKLINFVNKNAALFPVKEFNQNLLQDLTKYMNYRKQNDDITIFSLRFVNNKINSITLPAQMDSIKKAQNYIANIIQRNIPLNCKNNLSDILLTVEEVIVNIIKHAYPKEKAPYFEIGIEIKNNAIYVFFIDVGKKFDPTKFSKPATTLKNLFNMGFGCVLIKKLTDELYYRYQDGHNILTMIYKIKL